MRSNIAFHFRNVRLVCTENGYLPGQDIDIQDGRIASVHQTGTKPVPIDAEMIEARGVLVLPGFVNTHNHSP